MPCATYLRITLLAVEWVISWHVGCFRTASKELDLRERDKIRERNVRRLEKLTSKSAEDPFGIFFGKFSNCRSVRRATRGAQRGITKPLFTTFIIQRIAQISEWSRAHVEITLYNYYCITFTFPFLLPNDNYRGRRRYFSKPERRMLRRAGTYTLRALAYTRFVIDCISSLSASSVLYNKQNNKNATVLTAIARPREAAT